MQRISAQSIFALLAITMITVLSMVEISHAQSSSYRGAVGKIHREIELPSIDENKMVKLSDFRGKKLLVFHFASW